MATINSPDIVQNIMGHGGWYITDGKKDSMQAICVYEYHNTFFHKISFSVCYSEQDDVNLRTSPAVGMVLMLWSKERVPIHPIGTLAKQMEEAGVAI